MSDITFMMDHTKFFGEILWDILAFVFLVGVIVFYFVRRRQMNKMEEELEDEISNTYAETDGRARGSF